MADSLEEVTLSLEAAIDEEGGTRVWQRDVKLRLLHAAAGPSGERFWRKACESGCGGELLKRSGSLVHGRLGQCAGLAPPRATQGYSTSDLASGSVGWVDAAGELVLALDGAAAAPEGGVALFATADLDQVAAELRKLPTEATTDAFDPPLRVVVSGCE